MLKNVTRADLADAVFRDLGLSYCESEKLVDEIFEQIVQAFERGEDVKLTSFASFNLKHKAPRMGRNPKTGEEHEITERLSVSFIPSQALRQEVKDAPVEEK